MKSSKSLTYKSFRPVRQKVQSWQPTCISSVRLNSNSPNSSRRKAVWGPKRLVLTLGLAFGLLGAGHPVAAQELTKLDPDLQARATAGSPLRTSRVIVTLAPGGNL